MSRPKNCCAKPVYQQLKATNRNGLRNNAPPAPLAATFAVRASASTVFTRAHPADRRTFVAFCTNLYHLPGAGFGGPPNTRAENWKMSFAALASLCCAPNCLQFEILNFNSTLMQQPANFAANYKSEQRRDTEREKQAIRQTFGESSCPLANKDSKQEKMDESACVMSEQQQATTTTTTAQRKRSMACLVCALAPCFRLHFNCPLLTSTSPHARGRTGGRYNIVRTPEKHSIPLHTSSEFPVASAHRTKRAAPMGWDACYAAGKICCPNFTHR